MSDGRRRETKPCSGSCRQSSRRGLDVKVQPKKESATLTVIDNTNDVYLDSTPTLAVRLRNLTVNNSPALRRSHAEPTASLIYLYIL
jgi:hypothetical protein